MTGAQIQFAKDTYQIPAGFDWFNNRTWWDRTNRWELLGPDSPQMDQWHRSGIVVTGPRRHFRILGSQGNTPNVDGPYLNSIRIWPAPAEIATPIQFAMEFLSIAAVNFKNTGVFAQYFTNDSDTPLLDDQALIMGMKWLFWEIKGFGSYTTMQNRWVDYVQRLIARDGAAPTLNVREASEPDLHFACQRSGRFLSWSRGPKCWLNQSLSLQIIVLISFLHCNLSMLHTSKAFSSRR